VTVKRGDLLSRHGVLGLAMVGGSLLLLAWAIYHLIRTGSCASGGVYVSARPCPAGTGGHVLALLGSIFLALGGVFVARSMTLGILWFGMLFTVIGGAALLVAWGPASPPESDSGGVVMGIVFVAVMGIPPILAALSLGGTSDP
jgi:hypothetical protein